MRRIVIISFTEQGSSLNRELNLKLKQQNYACESYAVKRFAAPIGLSPLPSNVKEWIGLRWGNTDFVFIGAVGIAVRYIAAYAEDKYRDSAVISMDERGRFVIPLLSGHVGGGVELAEVIASCVGAVPVITTATDIQGRFAVDVFAGKNGLRIGSRELAKRISAAVLEGKKIGFYSKYPVKGTLPPDLALCEKESDLQQFAYGISVTGTEGERKADSVLYLVPRDLILGIGCRKGVPYQRIAEAVHSVFQEKGWEAERIGALASIDLKQEEPGILELAEAYGVPFYTYSVGQLGEVEEVSSGSSFVQSVTGVDNVCERAAKRCCPEGSLLLPKQKLEQVTLAVVKKNVEINF